MPVVFANDFTWDYSDTATITVNTDDTAGSGESAIAWDTIQYYFNTDHAKSKPKNLREALGEPDWEL